MDASVKLSEEEWKVIRNAYCTSGLTIADFYREKIHLFCPGGRKPSRWATYERLKGLYAGKRPVIPPGQVDIVCLDGAELIGRAVAGPGKNRTAPDGQPHGTVRLFLPQGMRLEIDTPSPEAFMLAVIGQLGDAQ